MQTKDRLEEFILEGDAKDVNFWCCRALFDRRTESFSHEDMQFCTDRGLRYVIEDRVLEVRRFNDYVWRLCMMFTEENLFVTDQIVVVQAFNATNRMVILAAARAMGLTYESE